MTRRPHIDRRWWLALRALLAAGLVALLVYAVDWRELAVAFGRASGQVIALGFLVYYLGVALSCYKWQILLRLERLDLPFSRLVRWYLISAFASNFLPTEIGGDLGRVYLVGRHTGRTFAIARSVFAERLSGLLFLLGLALVGVLVMVPHGAVTVAYAAAGAMIAGGVGLAAWSAPRSHPALAARLATLRARLPLRLRQVLDDSVAVLGRMRDQPRSTALVLLVSLLFQLLAGFGVWMNLYAVGAVVPVGAAILSYALAGVASMLPITPSGWGIREGVLVAALAPYGPAPAQILAGALLARTLVFVATLPGGLLLMLEGRADVAHGPGMRDER